MLISAYWLFILVGLIFLDVILCCLFLQNLFMLVNSNSEKCIDFFFLLERKKKILHILYVLVCTWVGMSSLMHFQSWFFFFWYENLEFK